MPPSKPGRPCGSRVESGDVFIILYFSPSDKGISAGQKIPSPQDFLRKKPCGSKNREGSRTHFKAAAADVPAGRTGEEKPCRTNLEYRVYLQISRWLLTAGRHAAPSKKAETGKRILKRRPITPRESKIERIFQTLSSFFRGRLDFCGRIG